MTCIAMTQAAYGVKPCAQYGEDSLSSIYSFLYCIHPKSGIYKCTPQPVIIGRGQRMVSSCAVDPIHLAIPIQLPPSSPFRFKKKHVLHVCINVV
ncbi:hypothetical protein M431DRAFT_289143 [Trichoderma harzianum CBS 226.95]|uniref:Uncharacterized protein n=1 Tax=Trichoderma harzianum CBS 226.95 TaxID=983964 RepID=A0A2T4APN8_TRIHA|nr:hypothetical protein M431DRAFT_289143 [Trichoderma harzianum CBS 226.95]PTB58878.1 hypothetical protein M431DRAFT_289143 [Trichoderma harzianum CBS 226.95]